MNKLTTSSIYGVTKGEYEIVFSVRRNNNHVIKCEFSKRRK